MKNEKSRKSVSPTPEQVRNAFRISLGTACAMGVILISYVIFPPTYSYASETIILTLLVGLAGLASTWLSRKQRSNLGVFLLIISLQLAVLMTGFRTSGMGIVFALITLVITFGIATSSLPHHLANRANAVAIVVGIAMILLDLTEPWAREPVANPTMVWATGGGLSLVFIYVITRQFRTYRLRTKIALILISVTLITAGMLLGISQYSYDRATQSNVGQALENNAIAQGTAISDFLTLQAKVLVALSLNETLQAGIRDANAAYSGPLEAGLSDAVIQLEINRIDILWQEDADHLSQPYLDNPVAEFLREFQSYFSEHAEILLIDRYGALVAATETPPHYSYANNAWWQSVYEAGKSYIDISESTAEERIWVVVPVRASSTGEIIGVLRSGVPTEHISALLTNLARGTRQTDIITDGVVWLGTDRPASPLPISQELWDKLQAASEPGFLDTDYQDNPYLLGYTPIQPSTHDDAIQQPTWIVVVSELKSNALATTKAQSRQNLLLALGTIAFAAVASTGLATMLTAPITRLTQVAQEIAAGNTHTQAVVETEDEVGLLATSFNNMTSELRQLIDSLEQRIENRTKALQATIDVSQRISTILDPNQLTREIANELQSVFDYYHVHVYLLDETSENLVMVGGSGEPGRIMLAQGHKISRYTGLVGSAASQNRSILVSDVGQDPNWLPNPLLPDTQSEVAVPISIGTRVLGVLDVQQSSTGQLSQSDAALLESIANQLAIAIQNTRTYAEAQQRAEREALVSTINQKLQKANTFDEILKTALDELKQALDLQQGSIEIGLSAMHTDRDR